jgi:hypothetical protein
MGGGDGGVPRSAGEPALGEKRKGALLILLRDAALRSRLLQRVALLLVIEKD